MNENYNRVIVRDSAILTTSYVASTVLGPTVVNPQYNKSVRFFVEITLGSLTSVEVKVEGSPDGTAYSKLHGPTEYSFTASGTYIVTVPAFAPYVKASVKGTGTVTDSIVKMTAICSDTPFIPGEYDANGNLETTIATKVSTPTDAPVYSYPAKASYKYQAAAADNVVVSAGPATLLAIILGDNVANASIEISDHASDGDGNIVALPAGGDGTDDLLKQSLASKFKGVITFGPNGMFCATGITCDQIAQTKCTYIYLTY